MTRQQENALDDEIAAVSGQIRTLERQVGDVSLRLRPLQRELELRELKLNRLNALFQLQTERLSSSAEDQCRVGACVRCLRWQAESNLRHSRYRLLELDGGGLETAQDFADGFETSVVGGWPPVLASVSVAPTMIDALPPTCTWS